MSLHYLWKYSTKNSTKNLVGSEFCGIQKKNFSLQFHKTCKTKNLVGSWIQQNLQTSAATWTIFNEIEEKSPPISSFCSGMSLKFKTAKLQIGGIFLRNPQMGTWISKISKAPRVLMPLFCTWTITKLKGFRSRGRDIHVPSPIRSSKHTTQERTEIH